MKRGLIAIILIISFISLANAQTKIVEKCIKVNNIGNYSEMVLIGYPVGDGNGAYVPSLIEQNECIETGNVTNRLHIYYTTKQHYDEIGLEEIKPLYDSEVIIILQNLEAGREVINTSEMTKEEIIYKILGFTEKNGEIKPYMFVYQEKIYRGDEVSEKNNSPPNIIGLKQSLSEFKQQNQQASQNQTSANNQSQTKNQQNQTSANNQSQTQEPKKEDKSFWNTIRCFFKWLFGGEC